MGNIEQRALEVTRLVLVKPASIQERDTGKKRIIKTVDKDGKETDEQVSVFERVQIDAEYKEVKETKYVWLFNDGTDTHEFTTEKEAQNFRASLNKKK